RLREVLEGTTTLIVAHRTSTVALADRVALLDGGKVVAVGTHVDLMASSARYRWAIAQQEEEARRDQDIETMTGELDLRGPWGDQPEANAAVPASRRNAHA